MGYLYLPGESGNYASTPDAAALDITGDLVLIAELDLDDWTPASVSDVVNKWGGATASWWWQLNTDGTMRFRFYDGGGTLRIFSLSDPVTSSSGIYFIGIALDVDNGSGGSDVEYFDSADGSTWNSLQSRTIGTTNGDMQSSSSDVYIGTRDGTNDPLMGGVRRVKIASSGDIGTSNFVFDADFTQLTASEVDNSSFTEETGKTVTLNGSAWHYKFDFQHGKETGVWLNEFDFASDLTQYNFARSRQLVNVTTMPAAGSGARDDKVFLAGLAEGQINVQGVWNPAANQTDEEIVALDGTEVVISAITPTRLGGPGASSVQGDRVHMVNGELDNYQPRAPHNDAVRFSASYTGDGAWPGVVLHASNQETSTGNFDSVASGAGSTSNGATAFLHVTQFSGTDATVTIEDSSDNSTYGSLVAFTQVTGTTSEKVTASGTVEQHVRVALTGTFTSITFVVSFARHLT